MQHVRIAVIGVGVVLLVLAGAVMCLAAVAVSCGSRDILQRYVMAGRRQQS